MHNSPVSPIGHLPAVPDDVEPDVVNRPPDRNGLEIVVRRAIEVADVDCRLGRAVQVGQSSPGPVPQTSLNFLT